MQDVQKREAILRTRGVPDRFVAGIARKKPGSKAYVFLPFVWLPIFFAAIVVCHDAFIGLLDAIYAVGGNAAQLFFPDSGPEVMSIILLIVLGLSLPAWAVAAYVLKPSRDGLVEDKARYKMAVKLRSLDTGEDMSHIRPAPGLARLSDLGTVDEFLSAAAGVDLKARQEQRRPVRRKLAIIFLTQCAVTIAALLWMHTSYTIISGDNIEFRSPFSDQKIPLSKITSADTDCLFRPSKYEPNHFSPYYTVRYHDFAANLFDGYKLGSASKAGDFTSQIAAYDRLLASNGIPVTKIDLHKASPCIEEISKASSDDRRNTLRILTAAE